MTSTYEFVVLFSSDLNETDVQNAQDVVVESISKAGGTIKDTEVWGKRPLAYAINKKTEAFYVFYTVEIDGSKVVELDKATRLNESIIRHLIVKQDVKKKVKKEADEVEKSSDVSGQSSVNS